MYKEKKKIYFLIALIIWILRAIGLLIMGILHKNGVENYNIIGWLVFIFEILIVIVKDKSIINLGFTKEKIKSNLIFSVLIIMITFIISVVIGKYSLPILIKHSLYYLFEVALVEEIVYRGVIQNYLFGLKCNKYIIFSIGATMFSLAHIPFQMYVHDNVSVGYIVEALPQLILLFVIHLILCFITYKRKDITIPTALHYALNYLQL